MVKLNKSYSLIGSISTEVNSSSIKPKTIFKSKVKEKWRKDALIKIQTLLEVTENPKGCFSNKEKLINVNIKFPYGSSTSTSFVHTKKGKRQALNFIKEICYL